MPTPKIPTEADFTHLKPHLHVHLTLPNPPEATSAFLLLLHGLGDHESPFANFATGMNLPTVACLAVRGTAPLPAMVAPEGAGEGKHFHWGDDVRLDPATGEVDEDPGFERAGEAILGKLIKETIVERLGWEVDDIMVFGFGQGGSLGLGLASRLANARVVEEEGGADGKASEKKDRLKGVISLGGPLPLSMVSTVSARKKSKTKVLMLQVSDEAAETAKREFEVVDVVKWKRREVDMPRSMQEMFPIMGFIARNTTMAG